MAEEASAQIQRNQIRGRRLKPRSKVWEHFTRHTGDDGNETAKCKRCGKVYAYHGTKNLWEHYNEGCDGQESADAGTSEQPPQGAQDDQAMQQLPRPPVPLPPPACARSLHGGSSDRRSSDLQEAACKDLARMIALDGYNAAFLESDYFRSFVRRFNPEFEVPSRVVVENMCDGICAETRKDFWDRRSRAPGKVSVAVGRAKTMEEDVFYTACHFIDDGWNLHKLLLHATVTGAERVPPLRWLLLNRKIFMVAYETTDKDIHPALKDTNSLFEKLGPNRKELFTTYVDNVLHSIARCLLNDEYFTQAVSMNMRHLNMTRKGCLELFAELHLDYAWACDEQWYACYCSLEILWKKGFPYYELSYEHSNIAKPLCKLWKQIYRAIQKISSSTGPTANLCLAELFELRYALQSELARYSSRGHGDDSQCKHFRRGLREACNTLDKDIEDSCLAWSLPLVLDPRYKLTFITSKFKSADGSEAGKEYVSKVRTMITKLYADYVEEYDGTTDGAHHSNSASALEQALNEPCRSQQGTATQVSSCYHPEAETELDCYLKDPPHDPQAEGNFDILNWWKTHSSKYPMVARMARDALAMPACSNLSSDQMAQLRSILRGYSKKRCQDTSFLISPKRYKPSYF